MRANRNVSSATWNRCATRETRRSEELVSIRLGGTRSHLINARTSQKGRHLQDETVETQPNHHFPPDFITAGLWFPCHKTIYEITSSFLPAPHPYPTFPFLPSPF